MTWSQPCCGPPLTIEFPTQGSSSPPYPFRLHLLIIGAGPCGLSAAISAHMANHTATILERTPTLTTVGAGLAVSPNATRLLRRWDIYDRLAPLAVKPRTFSTKRYDGTVLLARET